VSSGRPRRFPDAKAWAAARPAGAAGNPTIAGQTAPGGGIQLRGDGTFGNNGSMLWLNGNNTIVRYLRLRPGNAPLNASQQGLIGITVDGATDIVLDHNSFEWDSSKAVSFWSGNGLQRSTLSWNIDAESLAPHSTGPIAGNYAMGQANLDQSSWDGHHNVLATLDHRLPYTNFKYGRWINNLAFGYFYAALVRGGANFDFIGNVFDGGLSSRLLPYSNRREVRWADTVATRGCCFPAGRPSSTWPTTSARAILEGRSTTSRRCCASRRARTPSSTTIRWTRSTVRQARRSRRH
jgi:hypothetical protein